MKAGHVFTIEPMINQGTWEDKTWPDQWTAVFHNDQIIIRLQQMVRDLHNSNTPY